MKYSTLQVYQRSNSQVRHIPPKMSDKCPTNLRVNTLYVRLFGRTFLSDVRVDIKIFFYISQGEYVKHFVIDAYL